MAYEITHSVYRLREDYIARTGREPSEIIMSDGVHEKWHVEMRDMAAAFDHADDEIIFMLRVKRTSAPEWLEVR